MCKLHFKVKEKVPTITSEGFKNVKEYTEDWTAVEKRPSSFQNFHLILDKCNTITAELLENETVKFHPPSAAAVLTNDIKLNRILKQQTKEI